MDIHLSAESRRIIERRIAGGRYTSAGEVIAEALELLEAHEDLRQVRLERLRKAVAIGVEQMERGEHTRHESTEELKAKFEQIKADLRHRFGERRKNTA